MSSKGHLQTHNGIVTAPILCTDYVDSTEDLRLVVMRALRHEQARHLSNRELARAILQVSRKLFVAVASAQLRRMPQINVSHFAMASNTLSRPEISVSTSRTRMPKRKAIVLGTSL